jgi:hypothetical protein
MILSLLIAFTGCPAGQKKAAQGLVKTGTDTMDQLASFYDTLAQDRADFEELVVFLRLQPAHVPETAVTKQAFKANRDALQARAAHARSVKELYVKLGNLIDYDASGEVQTAVKNLLAEATKVKNFKLSIPLPGGGSISQDTITLALNKGIELLTTYLQVRDFRKNAPKVAAYLDYIKSFYDAETLLYVQIIRDYDDMSRRLAHYLIAHNQASGLTRFQKYAEKYGLQINSAPLTDDAMKQFTDGRIDDEYAAGDAVANDNVKKYSKGLADLIQAHQDFMVGGTKQKQ